MTRVNAGSGRIMPIYLKRFNTPPGNPSQPPGPNKKELPGVPVR
jgi:hypothetical protein